MYMQLCSDEINYCKVDPVDARVYTVHCLHVFTLFELLTRIVFSYIYQPPANAAGLCWA